MVDDGLPVPSAFEQLTAWAGEGRVVRAHPADLAGWRLPEAQKAALISSGMPLVEDPIDAVTFRSDPSGRYWLAKMPSDSPSLYRGFGAEPGTGRMSEVCGSGRDGRFVNSSVIHWLCSLHLVGTRLTRSTVIGRWDEDAESEEAAITDRQLARAVTMNGSSGPPSLTVGSTDHR